MNSTIIEFSFHACNFVLKVLDREEPGARVWPKLMSKLQPKIGLFIELNTTIFYDIVVSNCLFVTKISQGIWFLRRETIHRPECYCLSRHVLAVPSLSTRGIIICISRTSRL